MVERGVCWGSGVGFVEIRDYGEVGKGGVVEGLYGSGWWEEVGLWVIDL